MSKLFLCLILLLGLYNCQSYKGAKVYEITRDSNGNVQNYKIPVVKAALLQTSRGGTLVQADPVVNKMKGDVYIIPTGHAEGIKFDDGLGNKGHTYNIYGIVQYEDIDSDGDVTYKTLKNADGSAIRVKLPIKDRYANYGSNKKNKS